MTYFGGIYGGEWRLPVRLDGSRGSPVVVRHPGPLRRHAIGVILLVAPSSVHVARLCVVDSTRNIFHYYIFTLPPRHLYCKVYCCCRTEGSRPSLLLLCFPAQVGLVYACDEKEEENAYLPFHDNATSMKIKRKVFERTLQIISIFLSKNYDLNHKNLCMQKQIIPGISHSTIQVEKVGCRPPPPPLLIAQRTLAPPPPRPQLPSFGFGCLTTGGQVGGFPPPAVASCCTAPTPRPCLSVLPAMSPMTNLFRRFATVAAARCDGKKPAQRAIRMASVVFAE